MRISDWSSDVCSSDLILLRLLAVAAQMIVCEIDAAAPGHALVDDDQLAMQATEDLRTPAEYPIHRIVDVNADAGLDHRLDERLRQRCRTPAVEGHLDIDAALRGGAHRFLQRLAGGIVEQDDGF